MNKTNRVNANGLPVTFSHWGDAKIDLLTELGSYCSFCEREGYRSSLDVEHIFAKDLPKYRHLMYRWDNFLLACKNCNPVKGTIDVNLDDIYLPHLNNLLVAIEVMEGGVIGIKKGLTGEQERKTENFINLVGLDRDPAHPQYSSNDDRWETRFKVWNIANNYLNDYKNHEIKLQRIIEMARLSGFWSVWMKVFHNYPEVKQELAEQFPGTAAQCFDSNCNPLPRNGNNP